MNECYNTVELLANFTILPHPELSFETVRVFAHHLGGDTFPNIFSKSCSPNKLTRQDSWRIPE